MFDQFNASLLNKSFISFKNKYDKLFNCIVYVNWVKNV